MTSRILFIAAVLFALILALRFLNNKEQSPDIKKMIINNKELKVKIADSDEERQKGLANIEKLESYDGMLFIFEEKERVSFWNKNTLLDLDLVWISGGRVVGVDFLPNNSLGQKVISSLEDVDMVLEIPTGQARELGIKKGASVSINPQ